MSFGSASEFALVSEGINRLAQPEESPEPGDGLLAFARDLDAERRRLDRIAQQADLQTLNAQEVGE